MVVTADPARKTRPVPGWNVTSNSPPLALTCLARSVMAVEVEEIFSGSRALAEDPSQ